jgi:glycerol-3-phosphate dehydrogenase
LNAPTTEYDLAVIGAGIHGAGVAQAAAARGLSVLVVERREAAGMETSRASSKLIHGGLRYLETLQFRLVYECLREQRHLLRNAPHLVRRSDFYIPVYKHSRRSAWWVYLGLCCYQLLAGGSLKGVERIASSRWGDLGLQQQDLTAVFRYTDAQTDDQALTRAVLESAVSMGAQVRFNTSLKQIQSRSTYTLMFEDGSMARCRTLVNAAGPWANEVAALGELPQQAFDWVQGTHIVLPRPAMSGCFYVEAPQDGRAVFVLPWRGVTLVGTTELVLEQPKAEATPAEVDYLLAIYNHYFPRSPCDVRDVEEIFAGVRVLPKDRRHANKRSRETLYARANGGTYVGIYGGKLTSYRATADKVLQLLTPVLQSSMRKSASTADLALP